MPAFLKGAMMLVGTIAFSHASFNSLEKLYFVIFTTIKYISVVVKVLF